MAFRRKSRSRRRSSGRRGNSAKNRARKIVRALKIGFRI